MVSPHSTFAYRNSTMEFAQTIAMARNLLADGRAEDVVQMVEPLLAAGEDTQEAGGADHASLRALLARVYVVHTGDAERALALLAPYEDPTVRRAFSDPVRAELTLWLGWAHARHDETFDEEARALNLLGEAQRLFATELDASGRCWSLIGQAQAYFAIDEYQLMRQALEEAAALQGTIRDVEADRWIHDLSVPALRFQGRYTEAQAHIDALAERGETASHREVQGRACAYQAALYLDEGHPPERIIATAEQAEALLRRASPGVGYPLLAAYHAHIRALMLQGRWEEAAATIDAAEREVGAHPTARAHLQTLRARLALRRHRPEEAAAAMEDLFDRAHHLPHGLQRSHVALLRGELLAREGRHEAAQTWMERAYRNALETGHRGNQLTALLVLADAALNRDDPAAATDSLRIVDRYDDYFNVLPFAACRFRVLGRHAQLRGDTGAAVGYFNQSLSAYTLIGDAYRQAELRHTLAELDEETPSQARPRLDATTTAFESTIGASLARASTSTRLVAEAWIRAAGLLLPNRWIGVYRRTPDDTWSGVHEHGRPPASFSFPEAPWTRQRTEAVYWLPLHTAGDTAFYMGLAMSDPEEDPDWQEAALRLTPWLPVVQLALDRALMHRHRLDDALATNGTDHAAPLPSVPDGFVYDSTAMRTVVRQIDRMQSSHSPVLISGAPGVGKTTVARVIHATSERSAGPWHTIRCASVPPDPLAARLFGRGPDDPGCFQRTDGGTLLLQEIGALPLPLQTRLLHVLESGAVTLPDSDRPVPVDVRLLATTSEDLAAKVRDGRFREDLYYRLSVISLALLPLRERRADIPVLVRHFLDTLRPPDTPPVSITNRALETLVRCDWPGNVRQLHNEIERALVLIRSEPAPTLDVALLSETVRQAAPPQPPASADGWSDILLPDRDLSAVLARTEKEIIERVLTECDGQITASADMLGLTRQGLYKKMKRLDVDPAAFKRDTAPSALLN